MLKLQYQHDIALIELLSSPMTNANPTQHNLWSERGTRPLPIVYNKAPD
jgi:hypothetical protein